MEAILEAFGVDWRLIVIQVFNFTLLMGLLWYFLYTPLLKVLNERQEKIAKGVHDAEAAAEKLQNAETEKKDILKSAHVEAEEISQRSKQYADEKAYSIVAKAEEKAQNIISEADRRADQMKSEAIKGSESEVAKLAILAAEKVLREKNS